MSPKELKPIVTLASISKTIGDLLKEEKTILDIQAHTGLNSKQVQYIIDRYELEDKLLIPRLIGIR